VKITLCYEMSFHVPLIEGVGGGENQIQATSFCIYGNWIPRRCPGMGAIPPHTVAPPTAIALLLAS